MDAPKRATLKPAMRTESWTTLLGSDPRPWLLESNEPAARWVALAHLLDRQVSDPEVAIAHRAVLDDPGTVALIERITPWDENTGASGHHSPAYLPNLLSLLSDMGVGGGDDPRIEEVLDDMLDRQDLEGRFLYLGKWRGAPEPEWGTLLCDHHAITEVLIRYGRGNHPAVVSGLERMGADLGDTNQGRSWLCIPDPGSGFRGPGRKVEQCPQVTVEALRVFSRVPSDLRPRDLVEAARTVLTAWRERGQRKPYLFGHGTKFKTVKWPVLWYGAYGVLDALGRYPELWNGPHADPVDRRSIAEIAACLVAYNVSADGTVTPHSIYRGFEQYSFGQKKQPSPFATARLSTVLRRFDDLTAEIASIDVMSLGSSRGGTGTPIAPKV